MNVTMMAELDRRAEAAGVLAYLDTTGDFGALARETLIADAVRTIDADPTLAPGQDHELDAHDALLVMRDTLDELARDSPVVWRPTAPTTTCSCLVTPEGQAVSWQEIARAHGYGSIRELEQTFASTVVGLCPRVPSTTPSHDAQLVDQGRDRRGWACPARRVRRCPRRAAHSAG